jgi:2-oxo-4-hydroxy-4-carboxy--5-ureidoimidazoline (OHCU) decarboxylase
MQKDFLGYLNDIDEEQFFTLFRKMLSTTDRDLGACDWAIQATCIKRPFTQIEDLQNTLINQLLTVEEDKFVHMMTLHDRCGVHDKTLTEASSKEMSASGVDWKLLSQADADRFLYLNKAYEAKFGYVFMITLAGKTKEEVLHAMERRLDNDVEEEMAIARFQMAKLMRLRFSELVDNHS